MSKKINIRANETEEGDFRFLLNLIPSGEDCAISMKLLSQLVGTTERGIRKLVELARRSGLVICSTESGYFLPETIEEVRRYYHTAESRIRTCSVCLVPVRKLLEEEDGFEYEFTLFP